MALLLSGSVRNKSSPNGYTNLTQVQYQLGNSPTTGTGYTIVVINGIATQTNSLGNLTFLDGAITSNAPGGNITINPTGTGTVTINGPVNIPSLTTNLKIPVRAATTSSVDIFAAPNVVDGITLVQGDRVLVRQEDDPTLNGIYYVTVLGTGTNNSIWLRAQDANSSTSLAGAILNASDGITYGGRYFFTTFKKGQVLGTDPIYFYQFVADTLNQAITNKTIDATQIGSIQPDYGRFQNLVVNTTSATVQLTPVGTNSNLTIWPDFGYMDNVSIGLNFPVAATFTNVTVLNRTSFSTSTFTGPVRVEDLTSATSTNTGALSIAGGLGVGGDVFANHYYSNGVPLNNIYWNGGTITSRFFVNNTETAFNTQTGAIQVSGGVGIGQDLYVGKSITLESRLLDGNVFFRMRNTATNGQSYTWDVGGNNRAGTAGTSLSEGSLTLYDDVRSAYRLAVGKVTGNLLVGPSFDNGVDKLQLTGSLQVADSQIATRATIINNGNQTVIDSFPLANYRSTRAFVQITDGVGPSAAFHTVEIMIIVDNIGQTFLTQYGITTTQGERGTFDVDYNNQGTGLIRLLFTPTNAFTQKTVKVFRSSITK